MELTNPRDAENVPDLMNSVDVRDSHHPVLYGPFKNKNRTRLGIVCQLLEIAREECLKTHLMFGANLSFRAVTRYLEILVGQGLVSEFPDESSAHKTYKVSARGVDFLNTYYLLESFLRQ